MLQPRATRSDAKWLPKKFSSVQLNPKMIAEELVTEVRLLNWDPVTAGDYCDLLMSFCHGFVDYVTCGDEIRRSVLSEYREHLLFYEDIKLLILKELLQLLNNETVSLSEQSITNLFYLLRELPAPVPKKRRFVACYFNASRNVRKHLRIKRMQILYQTVWLSFLRLEHRAGVLKCLLPFLAETVMAQFPQPQLLADFFVRSYELGDPYNVLALAGIFELMVKHNFEYSDFYAQVYGLTQSPLCYSIHRKRFFELLDLFLSSTHVPSYVVAAFIKRLCRLCLLAPVECVLPLLSLIRNLFVRHPSVRFLLHRAEPVTVETDPYDMDEVDLQKCGAMNSSVWELKTLQQHWFLDAAKRANLVDKGVPHLEGSVRWKTADDIWEEQTTRRIGSGEEEERVRKRPWIQEEREEEGEEQVEQDSWKTVPIAFKRPHSLFESDTFEINL